MKSPELEKRTAPLTIEGAVNPQPTPIAVPKRGVLGRLLRRPRNSEPTQATEDVATRPRRRFSGHGITFILFAILPSFALFGYLALVASDQFIAVAKFAVRSAAFEQPVDLPSGAARTNSLPMVVGQDAYIIVSYIRSHRVIQDIAERVDIRAVYQHPIADFWERLKKDASAEDLVDYWNKRVHASVDGPSGIVTVRVRAFTPDDSVRVLNAIIWASEKLANEISARARRDMVQRAEEEVNRAMGFAQAALNDLQKFRERVGFLDPVSSATMTNSLLLQLLGEKIKAENELYVIERLSPDNSTGIRVLQTNINSIQLQIDRLKDALTGSSASGNSIATALVDYERLEMQRLLSQKLLSLSQESLQRAAQRADRQNIYVTPFISAYVPQSSIYPERTQYWIMYTALFVIIWGIFTMLVATVNDHKI